MSNVTSLKKLSRWHYQQNIQGNLEIRRLISNYNTQSHIPLYREAESGLSQILLPIDISQQKTHSAKYECNKTYIERQIIWLISYIYRSSVPCWYREPGDLPPIQFYPYERSLPSQVSWPVL